jgi:hypothetical protein
LRRLTLEVIGPEIDGAEDGRGGCLTKTADRGIGHGPADIFQALPVARQRPILSKAIENFRLTLGSQLAGETFSATLMCEEVSEIGKSLL